MEKNKFDAGEERLNIGQLAERWKVSRPTAAQMACNMNIPFHRQGNDKFHFISDIRKAEAEWLQGQEHINLQK